MRNIPHIIKRTILDKPNLWSRRYSGFLHLIEVLIIIIGTCFISCQANIIAHTQVASAKLEAQPHFLIHQSLEPNSDGDENANSVVKVINQNGLFYNLNIDEVCILNLIQNEKIAKQFLLEGFYYAHLVGTDEDGLISTFYCENNYAKYMDVYWDTLRSSKHENAYVDLLQYFRISYADVYGESHTLYFSITQTDQTLLPASEGSAIFELAQDSVPEETSTSDHDFLRIDIDDISFSYLEKYLT